jgi:hypothetical protein
VDFCNEQVMERCLSSTFGCVKEASVRWFKIGDRNGKAPEYVSYLWVGWPPQCQIIDGPACRDVLVWDEVCQVGMWVFMPATAYRSLTSVRLTLMSAMVKNVDSLPMC